MKQIASAVAKALIGVLFQSEKMRANGTVGMQLSTLAQANEAVTALREAGVPNVWQGDKLEGKPYVVFMNEQSQEIVWSS